MSTLVGELYGQRLTKKGQMSGRSLDAICPFSKKLCDGGGNRDMARIRSSDEQLAPLYTYNVSQQGDGYFPCGVCSVEQVAKDTLWAICPRRLRTPCWMDILGAAHVPKLESLEAKLETKVPIARLTLP